MTHTLFFYGTLCVPEVLERVLGHQDNDSSSSSTSITVSPAFLPNHVRLHVKGQDYPALVTLEEASQIPGYETASTSEGEERKGVQGVVVEGLSDQVFKALIEFEGDEYSQIECEPVASNDHSKTYKGCIHFHYTAPLENLEPREWNLEDFLKDCLDRWVGQESREFIEVEEKRKRGEFSHSVARNDFVQQEFRTSTGEKFGREVRERYWGFEKGWTNLNHGSYGAAPLPVVSSFLSIRNEVDQAPDRYMRITYEPELIKLRTQLSQLVDCDLDDLVIVPSATMGVNCALQSMTNEWKKRDKLLYFDSTVYQACKMTLQSIVDSHPHLDLSLLPVKFSYPISHEKVLELTREAIREAEADGVTKVRLALIDGISSNPGVIVPWEKLVELFKEKDVVSLVDAAHNIGQLPVSLRTIQPDFWISNCHKWLLAHRGCAILHVNKRLQHLVHSVPISHFYQVRTRETAKKWVEEFIWTGTLDWSPILSTLSALEFRKTILGGEEKITRYCHDLAIRGGELVAEILGTRTMRNSNPETEGELVANMINVLLPLPSQLPFGNSPPLEADSLKTFWWKTLIEKYKTAVPIFPHDGLPWVRLSAQVYTDLKDFEFVGKALREVCQAIERGEHLQLEQEKEGGVGGGVELTGAEEDE
ncbi:hypothetical protein JCM5350_003959 [Sporobolomyces pararoseus]